MWRQPNMKKGCQTFHLMEQHWPPQLNPSPPPAHPPPSCPWCPATPIYSCMSLLMPAVVILHPDMHVVVIKLSSCCEYCLEIVSFDTSSIGVYVRVHRHDDPAAWIKHQKRKWQVAVQERKRRKLEAAKAAAKPLAPSRAPRGICTCCSFNSRKRPSLLIPPDLTCTSCDTVTCLALNFVIGGHWLFQRGCCVQDHKN